jgi:hypothetical protein
MKTPQKWAVDLPFLPCQYCAMLGGTQKPVLPHPRSAKYKRARQKPNSYVQPSVFDMLAGASPASARDGWAE